MAKDQYSSVPAGGERVDAAHGEFHVPDKPVIPFIVGTSQFGDASIAAMKQGA
jgi:hypothetical protein